MLLDCEDHTENRCHVSDCEFIGRLAALEVARMTKKHNRIYCSVLDRVYVDQLCYNINLKEEKFWD
jgi:hypothetical protein